MSKMNQFNEVHIPDQSKLRYYQKECIDKIEEARLKGGSHLVVLPTGAGKTFTFTSIPRYGRVLILSHRDELVHQPERYYKNQKVYDKNGNLLPKCTFGVEQASEHSNGEEVISASVQSLIRRLDKFDPEYFDTIIIDEAHHSPAQSYRKIINYFKPNLLLGFTATPDRNDKVDLHEIFDDIIYMKDMRWGIEEGFLTDIECFQVNTGYNLDDVKIQMGDFHQPTLAAKMMEDDVMENTIKAYNELRKGQTIIFAVNVEHAYKLQKRIPRSVVVEANTPNRDKIFADFTARKFDCLINVFVVTEGTDLPLIETVMMVRPTKNLSLYTQCLGRGLRPAPGKDVCRLIDCVGVSKRKLATVGTLFGVDEAKMPEKDKDKLQGIRLTKMEGVIEAALDTPEFWISNKKQKLFESDNEVSLRYLNFVPLANDTLVLSLPNFEIKIPPTDALGNTKAIFTVKKPDGSYGKPQVSPEGSLQETIDRVHSMLTVKMVDTRILWDKRLIERTWGKAPASDKQKNYIKRLAEINHVDLSSVNIDELTKHQAGIIIERINQNEKLKAEAKPKSYSPYQKGKIKCQTNYK